MNLDGLYDAAIRLAQHGFSDCTLTVKLLPRDFFYLDLQLRKIKFLDAAYSSDFQTWEITGPAGIKIEVCI